MSLPLRQRQVMDELRHCQALGERTTAARLAVLMSVRYGVRKSQTYDLLGALDKKGVVRLQGAEWVPTSAAPSDDQITSDASASGEKGQPT
jgi:hypothetical protein